MHKPEFVTITGADERVDPEELLEALKPFGSLVELGFLHDGEAVRNRYPSLEYLNLWVHKIAFQRGYRGLRKTPKLALHLCKQAAKLARDYAEVPKVNMYAFNRVQINLRDCQQTNAMISIASAFAVRMVLQVRGEFPEPTAYPVDYLHDVSGGRGLENVDPPPKHDTNVRRGYAGGIRPDNVCRFMDSLPVKEGSPYYLDLETGVRDDNDEFCIDKAVQLLKNVYC
jgi:hypothetical protein